MENTSGNKNTSGKSDTRYVYSTIGFRPLIYDKLVNSVYTLKSRSRGVTSGKVINLALAQFFKKHELNSDKEMDKLVRQMDALGESQ